MLQLRFLNFDGGWGIGSFYHVFSCCNPQKDDKSQQQKVRNGITDSTPVQPALSPKPPSPDALKASIASLATISNINIDLHPEEDQKKIKRQVQGPQPVQTQYQADDEPVTRSVDKDGKGKKKPDPSPPSHPVKPPLKSVSGVGSRGGDEKWASNELLDVNPQATPYPGDTFSVCVEKQLPRVDDTMELLKEADMQNPKIEVEEEDVFSVPERKPPHKSSIGNIAVSVEENTDNKNDTYSLLKAAPSTQHTSNIQVSTCINTVVFIFFLTEWFLNFFLN